MALEEKDVFLNRGDNLFFGLILAPLLSLSI